MLEILRPQCYLVEFYHAFSFCFFMLSNFFIIPVVREKTRVKHAPAIPTGVPTTLTEELIQIHY